MCLFISGSSTNIEFIISIDCLDFFFLYFVYIVKARGRASTLNGTGRKTRMHGMDKMDTEGNSKKGKLENLKEGVFGWG